MIDKALATPISASSLPRWVSGASCEAWCGVELLGPVRDVRG